MALAAVTLSGGTASADPSDGSDTIKGAPADKLGQHDTDLLADAEARHEPTVMLIVATDKGRAGAVAAELKKLGGKVAKQVDGVGYVRAQVPTTAVRTATKIAGVAAVDLNEVLPLPKPDLGARPDGAVAARAVAPGPGTPAANPYLPTEDTGAVSFKKAHPTWDGRGVTIGIMDSGVDLDNPALRRTSTGEEKITDWITATDPLFDGDGTWRPMLTEVSGPSFNAAGATWTAPAGTYRFNRFSESITAPSEPGGDVNRDGDTTDQFGILYDPVSHDIRVDANQNRDFTDDPVMRPYAEKHDVGHFGTDNPATAVVDRMPFVVEYREDVDLSPAGLPGQVADFVNIGIVEANHGSHVTGIAAGNDMFGNPNFDGAAPGAKIVSARACSWGGGCTNAALTDGMIELVTNRHVDVVNMSIGGLPALNDGANARTELYNRLINDYGVQMFISAGNNGPGLNTIGDPSVATDVVSVAASVTRETWLSNYGSVVRVRNNLFNFSSRGPREDGGFKPNVSAPGAAVSTTPLWQAGAPVPEAGYPLPPGYAMFNGTSMAAPEATGDAALLLSAAKATDRGITPAALRRALYTAADKIPGVPAAGQGNGMVDVNGTWRYLKDGVETRRYTSDAPVCTPIADFLQTPGRGVGIYNRCAVGKGGLKAGQARTYQVKITRTSGPNKAIRHVLRWVNNDGTFRSAGSVDLPLNKAVTVAVNVKAGVGAHSAILEVDDPRTATVDYETMNTVVVSNEVTAPDFAFSTEGAVDRNSYTSFFVTVPEGAAALQVNLSGIATGSQTRFIAMNPYGVPVENTSSLACYTNRPPGPPCNPQERDYQNPLPGIWEIEIESRRTSPALANPYLVTARVQGVAVTPAVVQLPSVPANTPTAVSWSLKNTFGPVKVIGKGGPLGSAFTSRPTIADQETQTFHVTVPAGASRLDVVIGNPSDPAADLDLTVRLGGAVVAQSADGDSEEAVSIANPAAGTYDVEIDGFAVPAGTTQYDYRDVYFAAGLGTITVPSTQITLARGGTGTLTGSVSARPNPPAGRQLFGEATLVTVPEGAVVGRGSVVIGAVN